MDIDYSLYSNIGRRENNEDMAYFQRLPCGFLAVIADGLGGTENGEFASRQAVESVAREIEGRRFLEDVLEDAVIRANRDIFALQKDKQGGRSTIAVLWCEGERALAANVGDTRIYQLSSGAIVYQSVDHSLAQLAATAGEIQSAQIRTYPLRNRLTRSLGSAEPPWVDIKVLELRPGDRFLLCSDGFWDEITEEEIVSLSQKYQDSESWLHSMQMYVLPKAQDNNTAIAVTLA